MYWDPDRKAFDGQDAYIIGGGPSLSGFDFNKLKGKNVVGANSAYELGPAICPLCLFSDAVWLDRFWGKISESGVQMITHNRGYEKHASILFYPKQNLGLATEAIGYNGNSGAGAINVALIMGARRVFLLGFDCVVDSSQPAHWHQSTIEPQRQEVFNRFLAGFSKMAADLPKVFPNTEIINLNPQSALTQFNKKPLSSVL